MLALAMMAEHPTDSAPALKELFMRYAPAGFALSLLAAVSASMGQGATREIDPRAVPLVSEGRAALAAGHPQTAINAFEAALAIDPGHTGTYLDLAAATRAEGMQGKAIRYYRKVMDREPNSYLALAGEGEAFLEKGAIEKARRNLALLESKCGATCPETVALAERIKSGPKMPVLTAEAVTPTAVVTQN